MAKKEQKEKQKAKKRAKIIRRKAEKIGVKIYCVKLDDRHYYFGYTRQDLDHRINSFQGNGKMVPQWVKLHSTIELIDSKVLGKISDEQAKDSVDIATLSFMERVGFENVRGGHMTMTDPTRHIETVVSQLRKHNVPKDNLVWEQLKRVKLPKHLVPVVMEKTRTRNQSQSHFMGKILQNKLREGKGQRCTLLFLFYWKN